MPDNNDDDALMVTLTGQSNKQDDETDLGDGMGPMTYYDKDIEVRILNCSRHTTYIPHSLYSGYVQVLIFSRTLLL